VKCVKKKRFLNGLLTEEAGLTRDGNGFGAKETHIKDLYRAPYCFWMELKDVIQY